MVPTPTQRVQMGQRNLKRRVFQPPRALPTQNWTQTRPPILLTMQTVKRCMLCLLLRKRHINAEHLRSFVLPGVLDIKYKNRRTDRQPVPSMHGFVMRSSSPHGGSWENADFIRWLRPNEEMEEASLWAADHGEQKLSVLHWSWLWQLHKDQPHRHRYRPLRLWQSILL